MPQLDHLIVPCKNRQAAAAQLAELLDVPWTPDVFGIFSGVHVNDSTTFDFGNTGDLGDPDQSSGVQHYCFMVTDEEFDAIHGRLIAKSIPYRSSPHGPTDMKINTEGGGKNLYWFGVDGHNWEILTVSYAR
jgi:hypothetical protein